MRKLVIRFLFPLLLPLIIPQGFAFGGPIEDLKPGEWYEVPNSRIRDVLPNPIPPGSTGPESIIIAWNSGAYDTKRDRYIITGGGHQDYGGNELYAFDINTLKWTRVWGPSPNIPNTGGSCNETYSDGSPASRHTYDGLEYLPNVDKFWMHGGSLWCASGGASVATWTFDFNNAQWLRRADPYQFWELEEVSAYDPVTGHVFAAGPASGQILSEYDPVANKWASRGDRAIGYGQSATIDPVRRKFIAIGSGSIYSYDLNPTGTLTRQLLSTSGDTTMVDRRYVGIDFDPVSDRLIAWDGGASVYSLNVSTRVWTKINPAPTNTVIPTNPPSQGTFGRWRYVPSKNIFIVVNSIDQNAYIYRLSQNVNTPPSPPTNLHIIN